MGGAAHARWIAAFILVFTLLLGAWSHARAPAAGIDEAIRQRTLEAAGREPDSLRRDERLADIARMHSKAMFRRKRLSHRIDGTGPAERLARHHRTLFGLVSENVGMREGDLAQDDLAERLVEGWMNSPPHRANILADYALFEVGCHGDDNAMYCTQLFVRQPTRLARAVGYEQPTGATLRLRLESGNGADHRISVTPYDAETVGRGAPVRQQSAELVLPGEPGNYQVELWTRVEPTAERYRIVPGPLIRLHAAERVRSR